MRNTRWRKVLRDVWKNKTRTILVVFAIAVGIFAFSSAFISREVILAEMSTQYQSINPSTISLGVSSFDDSLVRWASHQENISDSQGQSLRLARLVQGNNNYSLDLYAFDNYEDMRVNRLILESGTLPLKKREIVFERSAIPLLGLRVGDNVVVELPNGQQHTLKVAGTVHDLKAIPANLWPDISAYVSTETMEWLGFPHSYNQLELVAADEFDSRAKLETLTNEIKEKLRDKGFTVTSVLVREPGEHWAQTSMASLVAILSSVGVFSLILSGFLVINTITGILAQQRRQVGIMKAIGATAWQIVGIYLTLVICFGLLALLVALPIGTFLAYFFTSIMAHFLNIDIYQFHVPRQIFILELVIALIVPLVAALVPILNGVRVSAWETISNYGITSRSREGWLGRLLMRIRGLPRPLLLSIRNTFRRRGRLFMTLGTLTLAGTLFISIVNVRGAMTARLYDVLKMYNFEIILILDRSYGSRMAEHRVEQMPNISQAEARTYTQVQRVKPDGTEGATFSLAGLPPESDFFQPTLLSGRWLQEKDYDKIVLSNELIRNEPDIKSGDEIEIKVGNDKYKCEVAGIIFTPNDSTAYAPFNYVSHIKHSYGQASSVFIKTQEHDISTQSEMVKMLEDHLKTAGIGVSKSITIADIIKSSVSRMDFLVRFLLLMSFMAAAIGGLGLAGTMSLNVLERTREIGVMRSIGATSPMVGGIVVVEGMLIGFISWLLAIPCSIPFSYLFNTILGYAFYKRPLDFYFSSTGLIIWLIIVIFISIVASLLPARQAMRMSVQETLAYE
jgi:putative ABC transport system permease protein